MGKLRQAKNDIVKAFLEWTDGLQSRPRDAKPVVIVTWTLHLFWAQGAFSFRRFQSVEICLKSEARKLQVMATNLPNNIDEAIRSRMISKILFSSPNFAQCKQHFATNAQLGYVSNN